MKFSDIPGHQDIHDRLRHMVDTDTLPHALLLEGPAGTGKFATARALAQYLHCEHRSGGEPCGVCPSCRQHATFNHVDTFYSFPVVKIKSKETISDDWLPNFREFISEYPFMDFEKWLMEMDNINAQPQIYVEEGQELLRKMNYMSRASRYKVVLMWLPERLHEATANKLLKLIEEPHADTKFIMVSNNPRAILPTIYSRTQRIAMRRYSDDEVREYLISCGRDPGRALSISRLAQGNINEALRLCELGDKGSHLLDLFMELMRKAYMRQIVPLREWSLAVAGMGREPAIGFLEYMARMLRENFILHTGIEDLSTLDDAERAFCARFFPFVNNRNVLGLVQAVNDARRDIAANGNAKIVLFDLAIKVILLIKK